MTARRTAAGHLPEKAFQLQVEQLAGFYSWRSYHTFDSRRSAAGFPDLVLLRPPEIIFAELKGAKTRVTIQQHEWLAELDKIARAIADAVDVAEEIGARGPDYQGPPAFDVYLWRPTDFDEIHERLARGRVRHNPIGAV